MDSSKSAKHGRAMNAVAAGTSDQTSSWIDTAGYDRIEFITSFGAITTGAVTVVKVQQAAISDGTGAADLAGSGVSVADDDDNQIVVHEIVRPTDRYVAIVIDRGTQNAVIDGVTYRLLGGQKAPETDDSTTVSAKRVLCSPAEGTA